ncbi:hypothetical protein HK097_004612 [Rhizophlyctis rosea]|uniref:Chitin-binding type-1 domain-containing protein n=1 Tax=Rhizophlyctis rosea TaxID=64517 RepID=A0AAD5X9W2_9FUNG|nr:hypothetical protein HK097_004612 [Rhizophlyctis rosea]
MQKTTILVLVACLLGLVSADPHLQPRAVVGNGSKCGSAGNGNSCGSGLCCSRYGYCGNTKDHCTANVCQTKYGSCWGATSTSTSYAKEGGRCGSAHGGVKCGSGLCCSNYGYCGKSSDHCGSGKCQKSFGTCSSATTTKAPTYTTAPQSFPNVPYTYGITTKRQSSSERAECLEVHNAARRNVNAYTKPKALTYSTSLENAACAWAQYLANTNQLAHSGGKVGGYGENLYRVSSSSPRHGAGASIGSCKTAASSWAAEDKYYWSGLKIGEGSGTSKYGHYTQMVWPSTTQVGCCGWQSADRKAETWVCEYSPQGNYRGQAAF